MINKSSFRWCAILVALQLSLGVARASSPNITPPPRQPVPLFFDEPADRAPDKILWPVSVGMPFAAGTETEEDEIALVDQSGHPINLQTKTTGFWVPSKTAVKWKLLDFQAEFGNGESPKLHILHGGHNKIEPKDQIAVSETADQIIINTGAIEFSVSKNHFNLLNSLKFTDGASVLKSSSAYWVNQDGTRYSTETIDNPTVLIETSGPLRTVIRAEGWYGTTQKERMMKYQIRITAFAGLPYIRIYHTLIWTEDDTVAMKEFGLSLNLAQHASKVRIGIEHQPTIAKELGKVEAVQEKYSESKLLVDGKTENYQRLSGWVQATEKDFGLAVSVCDFAKQVPKAFTVTPEKIDIQLWAPQAGLMSMKEDDRVMPEHRGKYDKEWITNKQNMTVSPQGVAKTHEIWLWPTNSKQPSCEAINDLIQRPVVVIADPVYQCSTNAIEGIRAECETPEIYRSIENGIDAMFRHISTPLESQADFDMWNFGDVHLFRSGPWRNWDGGGYNWPIVPWLLFYRSGQRDYFEHAIRNARHVMDVDVCHFAPSLQGGGKDPAYQYAPYTKVPGYTYTYSPLHWAWGPVGDVFWTHPSYLLYYYYLTGYERAGDVLGLMANVNDTGRPSENRSLEHVSREAYGKINPKTVYYEFTGKQSFIGAAQGWTDIALKARLPADSDMRVPPFTVCAPDGRFRNNSFFGFFYEGLQRVYQFTHDEEVKNGLLELVQDFSQFPKDAFSAPAWGRQSMIPFAFAYRVTGNDAYLAYPIWRIREQTAATQLTGEFQWYGGTGYSSLTTTGYPLFILGALQCLGAWADTGFKDLPRWPGNTPAIASQAIDDPAFRSGLTIFVRKKADQSGALRLILEANCLSKTDSLEKRKMQIKITSPDGQCRIVPLRSIVGAGQSNMELVEFSADQVAGDYKIEILGDVPMFWTIPMTNLPGMVVWAPRGEIRYEFNLAPSRLYFCLKEGQKTLGIQTLGTLAGKYARPLRILAPDDDLVSFLSFPGPQYLEVEIPQDIRNSILSLAKGEFEYGIWFDDLDGVALKGAYDYIATQPDQWFLPEQNNGYNEQLTN